MSRPFLPRALSRSTGPGRLLAIVCLVALALALMIAQSRAAEGAEAAGADPAAAGIPREAAIAGRLDRLLSDAADDQRFSAAALTVVEKGGPALSRAYGLERTGDRPIAARPDSRFLIASVTKTMTALAIVQLHDRGMIRSLDDPANRYLKRVTLDDYEGQAITVRDLLTHTSGLAPLVLRFVSRTQLEAPVDASFVKAHTTSPITRPGEQLVYSNLGMALLGIMVEDLSGKTLKSYMHEEIFAPLGMEDSRLNYDVVAGEDVVQPYTIDAGAYSPIGFEANTPFMAGAGSVLTTAADMEQYLRFWLGEKDAAGIVSPAMRAEMLRPQRSNPGLPAQIGLGLFLEDWNGTLIVEHTGAFSGYTSYMAFVPETGLGAFIATAGSPVGGPAPFAAYGEGADAIGAALTGKSPAQYDLRPVPEADRYAGTYLDERRGRRGIGKLLGYAAAIDVHAGPDGYLTIGGEGPFGMIGDGLVATAGDGNSPPRVYSLPTPERPFLGASATTFTKAGLLDRSFTMMVMMGLGIALCLVAIPAVFRARYTAGRALNLARWAPVAGACCLGAIFASLLLFFEPGRDIGYALMTGDTTRVHIANAFAWLVIGSAIAGFWLAWSHWMQRESWTGRVRWGRLGATASALGLAVLAVVVIVMGAADPRLV